MPDNASVVAGGLQRLWRAIDRVMGVDLAIGVEDRGLRATRRLRAADARLPAGGNVVVWAPPHESVRVVAMVDAVLAARIRQVIVLCRCQPQAPWFRAAAARGCSCCFVTRPAGASPLRSPFPGLVLYRGARPAAFEVGFAALGAVWRGREWDGAPSPFAEEKS